MYLSLISLCLEGLCQMTNMATLTIGILLNQRADDLVACNVSFGPC